MQDFQVSHPHQYVSAALTQSSGKMVLVDKLLTKLKESGHKVGVVIAQVGVVIAQVGVVMALKDTQ